jgi:hypothetical protein
VRKLAATQEMDDPVCREEAMEGRAVVVAVRSRKEVNWIMVRAGKRRWKLLGWMSCVWLSSLGSNRGVVSSELGEGCRGDFGGSMFGKKLRKGLKLHGKRIIVRYMMI